MNEWMNQEGVAKAVLEHALEKYHPSLYVGKIWAHMDAFYWLPLLKIYL